jgi:hypothetical protein
MSDRKRIQLYPGDILEITGPLKMETDSGPELLEALKNVTAHLVAAHFRLRDVGGKLAESNDIFKIMLKSYEKSIEVGHRAIAKAEGRE